MPGRNHTDMSPDLRDDWRMLALPSAPGLLLGALFFMASLTPSLIPREGLLQGALGGLALAAGYSVGAGITGIWRYLGFSEPEGRGARRFYRITALLAVVVAAVALSQATGWQNAVRAAMGMGPVESARPLTIALVAVLVGLLLLAVGRIFRLFARLGARALGRFLPPRAALLLSLVLAAVVFWSLGAGVLRSQALRALDATYRSVDALIDPAQPAPTEGFKSGGPGSLLNWEGLGKAGREMVAARPDRDEIAALSGGVAQEPLRIYVGLNSADEPDERAELALAEMLRTGAFDRANLLIATPTGTGWVDPAGLMPIEFLTRGDIATVSVQYSYLPSWLTLMVDTGYGAETAREVFRAVYGHWRSLPEATRPRLYLFGLSLGSVNADAALDLYDVIAAPFNGALWAGPPFANRSWREITAGRVEGTPVWLPEFRDGSVVRFASQTHPVVRPAEGWGPMRIVYLQYASDPIVFFTPQSLWAKPDFMAKPTGQDVSPMFRWVPVVTFLQLLVDMMTATTVTPGSGHVYAAENYINAWAAVIAPEGWDGPRLGALGAHLAAQGL